MYMYNLFDIPRILTNCLKKVMRNYENDLLEELRNNDYDDEDIAGEDSDEELSQIWSLSGNSIITDLGNTAIRILEDNSSYSNQNQSNDSSSDRYMVFVDNSNEISNGNNTPVTNSRSENRSGLRDVTGEHINQSESGSHDDEADDEDESDTSTEDSDSEDDMFDVCIRESMYRRRRLFPCFGSYRDRKCNDDDDDDDDNYKRPLTITPIKRRYSVAESLRVRVLKMEAAKSMASLFKNRCSIDS